MISDEYGIIEKIFFAFNIEFSWKNFYKNFSSKKD